MSDETQVERWVEQGRRALLRADARGAIEPLRQALTVDPEHAGAHLLLAQALVRLGRLRAALVEANAAVLHDPETTHVHTTLGDIHHGLRRIAEARRDYHTARELAPDDPAPLRGLARIAEHEDNEGKARALLGEALRLQPEDVETHLDLAELHLAHRRHDDAERHANHALELEPRQRRALVVMGHLHLHRGNPVEARQHALLALRDDATNRAAISLLAACTARESVVLGAWYRANVAVLALGPRWPIALLGAFIVQALLSLALDDLGQPTAAMLIRWLWMGCCYYSYAGPAAFRRMVERELRGVELRDTF